MAPRRKKWTEEEERSLLEKYAEMAADGSLSRLRTRERRFRPIAAHVNAAHHAVDPAAYPFLWSWMDAATKVHNMRHQYLLVKRKLVLLNSNHNPPPPPSSSPAAPVDWDEQGLSHWPNFLRYKSVFGDAPLPPADPDPASAAGGPFDNDGELGLGLGFDCCAEGGGESADREVDDDEGFDFDEVAPAAAAPQLPAPPPAVEMVRTKRKTKRAELRRALASWREREARMEKREAERARVRREMERAAVEADEERERVRRQALQQWREEELEWEGRMEGRRAEWRKRVEGMLREHRADMEQIQARIIHEQQSVVGQLLGVISQWATGPVFGGLSDGSGGTAMGNHHHHHHHQPHHQPHLQPVPYLSQMMQGLHHVNGIVPGENRVDGDGPEDHFIVDD